MKPFELHLPQTVQSVYLSIYFRFCLIVLKRVTFVERVKLHKLSVNKDDLSYVGQKTSKIVLNQ